MLTLFSKSRLTLFSIAFLSVSFLLSHQAQSKNLHHVVIVSVDGLRPDAISKSASPHIQAMKEKGMWAENAHTIVPSITLPSHTSMLTGRTFEAHQVSWNSYEPERGLVSVETCLEIAHKHGLSTAMFVGKEKFKHLNRPGSLDFFSLPGLTTATAAEVVSSFSSYVKEKGLPVLTFVHLPDTDAAGHSSGWMSSDYFKALKDIDSAMEKLLSVVHQDKNHAQTLIIFTADHGGTGKTHGEATEEHTHIPWIAFGEPIRQASIYKKPVKTYDTAATALNFLGIRAPQKWEGKPVTLQSNLVSATHLRKKSQNLEVQPN